MDFDKWYKNKQEKERRDAFMADTHSHAALIAGAVFAGIFIAGIFVLLALAVGG